MVSKEKKQDKTRRKGSIFSKEHLKSGKKQWKKSSPNHEIVERGLFGSYRFLSGHKKKDSYLSELEGITSSKKVATTDESNNCLQSKIHQSIFYSENKQPNEQYFQATSLKGKKIKGLDTLHASKRSSKSKDISCKLKEMKTLIIHQDKQVAKMKGTINEKELHRLIKMHSIERLKIVQSINDKASSKRKKLI